MRPLRTILIKLSDTSVNYNDMTANRIDVVELACEEYSQEVLGFSDMIASGNPTPGYDPIVFKYLLRTLTPSGIWTSEGDILILEALLNNDHSPPPNQGNYLLKIRKELKLCEAKTAKSSIDEPPEVELKDILPHLEYAFLEESRKRAIAWELSDIRVLSGNFVSHKHSNGKRTMNLAVPTSEKGNTKINVSLRKGFEKFLKRWIDYLNRR
ncbi:hypothetical protein Tco_0527546 [Tanacetum coccineum]